MERLLRMSYENEIVKRAPQCPRFETKATSTPAGGETTGRILPSRGRRPRAAILISGRHHGIKKTLWRNLVDPMTPARKKIA
jgi:hypothetical protein